MRVLLKPPFWEHINPYLTPQIHPYPHKDPRGHGVFMERAKEE